MDPEQGVPGRSLGFQPASEPWDVEQRRAGARYARILKVEAAEGGLRFEAFLPPSLATWLLELIEQGSFKDPSEAVGALVREMSTCLNQFELWQRLLGRAAEASVQSRPDLSTDGLFAELDRVFKGRRSAAAVWQVSVAHSGDDASEPTA